ncbi:MAG: hypothetical protein J6B95_00660 [Oscillospiraceae bacterium]|nr:hypothetical protein [Oscillospiraceae bacterium]
MRFLGKYWKVIIAVILLALAVFVFIDKYQSQKLVYELRQQQLEMMITSMQEKIAENLKYKDIQDELEDAVKEIEASRLDLYRKFPVELKEEDQIMYVLYLETLFDTEIQFAFGEAIPLAALQDGSTLEGLLITVNYETTYEGFKEMIDYLATDNRIASVYNATIAYDADKDIAAGALTLILYTMNTEALEYTAPDVAIPETGKENIFD